MCKSRWKKWIKFNISFLVSLIGFTITIILGFIRIVFLTTRLENKINGEIFTIVLEILLTISSLSFGFFWANYQTKKNDRINKVNDYIQDFTKSSKLIENIIVYFQHKKINSISEIREIVNILDKHFGLHYFNIFISDNKLPSIYISEQIGNYMIDINKRMKNIEDKFILFKKKFDVSDDQLNNIIDLYIENVNKNNKNKDEYMTKFSNEIKTITKNELSNIYIIELLDNIDAFLETNHINDIYKKLTNINRKFLIKSDILSEAINNCKKHSQITNNTSSSLCINSHDLIINKCINKSWEN